jgi:PAS domain S-box-containing protein
MTPTEPRHPDPDAELARPALLQALTDTADLVMVAREGDERLIWVNQAFLSHAEVGLKDAIGKTLVELGFALRQLFDDPQPGGVFRFKLGTPTGESRLLEGSQKRVVLGGQTLVVTIVRDVTEHDHVLEELRASRRFVTEIVDGMPVGFIAMDRGFRIFYANDLAADLLRTPRSELVGKVLWDLFPNVMTQAFGEAVVRVMDTEISAHIEQFYPPAEMWFDVHVDRTHSGLAAYLVDISERKHRVSDSADLTTLIESADDAIFARTLDDVITAWNPAAERLFGFTASEAIGATVSSLLLLPEGAEDTPEILTAIAAGERVEDFHTRRRHRDGRLLEVALSASPIRDASGVLIGASTIARDMRAVSRRMRDAARLAAIVETSQDAIMGFSREGLLTSWNPAAERIYGYSAEEALGRTPPSLLIPEGEPDDSTDLIRRVVLGEILTGVEVKRWRKDGTPIWLSMTISPIRDASGSFIGGSVIARDITRDREVAQELEAAEERYRNIVEQVPVIIYDWGVHGDLYHATENFVSPQVEEILGFGPQEWMADPSLWFTRLYPDDRARVEAATQRSIEEGITFVEEYRMLAKDGNVVWLRDEAVVMERDADGRATLFQGVQMDITAQKMAEHVVSTIAEQKTRMIQLLAHELFTPLTAIQGAAMTLRDLGERLGPEDLQDLADGVARGTTRLRRLVRNLETAAKVEGEGFTSSRVSVPLGEIVSHALDEFETGSEASQIDISIGPETAALRTSADLSLASQALSIVIDNALDYADDQPVGLEAFRRDDALEIHVSDRGPGVAAHARELIFDLFTQVDSSDARDHEGLGVGLFLARRVMRLHGGDLIYRERQGGGATFVLVFLAET